MVGNETHRRRRSLRSFLQDADGTATVEFVILFPLFTTLLLLVVDASMLFLRHTSLMNVSRDTARIVSRHAMTADEAKSYAEAFASTPSSPATAEVIIETDRVIVRLTTDSRSTSPFGIIPIAVGDKLVARAITSMEPV
ncbi:MAG: TadE/TadG family type IV pilus assembly protein [Pseudomonadota bacterium]